MCVFACGGEKVALPQRLDSAGYSFSAERALSPLSALVPPTEAPKASQAAPASTAGDKTIYEVNSAD